MMEINRVFIHNTTNSGGIIWNIFTTIEYILREKETGYQTEH